METIKEDCADPQQVPPRQPSEKALKLLGITADDLDNVEPVRAHRKRKSSDAEMQISDSPSKRRSFADRLRRTKTERTDAENATGAAEFKEMVEANLTRRGHHVRTRSKTPIVSFTDGKRERPQVPSVDFAELVGEGSEVGFKHFLRHLEHEHSEENLMFWKDVEAYQAHPTASAALQIVDKFVGSTAPNQINIPSGVERDLRAEAVKWRAMDPETPTPAEAFVEAQTEVEKLMQRDSLPRFKTSDEYVKYVIDR